MAELSSRSTLENRQDGPAPQAPPKFLFTSTGPWPFTARLAIGLSKTAADIVAICPAGHPLLKTRAVCRFFRYSPFRPLESLAAAIRATAPCMLIPCDDRAVDHVHELHAYLDRGRSADREVAALIERSLGSPESYPVVGSRLRLLEIAQEVGIRTPESKLIRGPDDCEALDMRSSPWVLKADGTWGGRGVKVAVSADQAKKALSQLNRVFGWARACKRAVVDRDLFWPRSWRRSHFSIIAQRYIHGTPANCAAVCCQGKVLAGIAVEVLSTEGIAKPATVVRIVDNPEMMSAATQIARRLGLSGFFGLDFIIERSTGAPYLIELNPRCTPLCHLRLGEGRDLIGALVAQLSGKPETPASPVTDKQIIAYFPQALRHQKDLPESSYLDVPRDEPEFVREMLRQDARRDFLARLTALG